MLNGEYFVCSERSMLGMAYQDMTKEHAKFIKVAEISGKELIGTPVKAPLCQYERVYVLPLVTITMDKGTGVVTSVPSDAPDDFAAFNEYKNDPKKREFYGIDAKWVEGIDVVPIIDIPEYGNTIAVKLCIDMKVGGQKDKQKLNDAKEIAYKQGFNFGVFTIGAHAGKKVKEVKDIIKQEMIDRNEACIYYEPEQKVISRTLDECIVAKVDQWLLKYGEESWKNFVKQHVNSENFETYHEKTKHQFDHVLDWLKEWGVSRTFGLGTHVPWDPQFVIESLSDSTIYMAFYTIAHQLQGGVFDGSTPGPSGILPEQLTDEVFDYIYLGAAYP